MKNKILLASDHAGFELKNKIFQFLKDEGFDVTDMGAHVMDKDDDYPKIMIPVAMRIVSNPENTKAIIFGKSGQGEAMIVNRFPGIRGAVYYGDTKDGNNTGMEIIRLSREHNDANVLSIGAGFVNEEEAIKAVKLWVSTPFSGDPRHMRRIEMLDNIE
jgi:ribose 5-phosphate isomerase B